MSDENELPTTQRDDFIADLEGGKMDLSSLYKELFLVSVSTGDRNKCKLLASTIKGPFSFVEMCEEVGRMYNDEMHHAKITILDRNRTRLTAFLDSGTTDYIEAHGIDIAMEVAMDLVLTGEEKTLTPGILTQNETKKE
jgi:hypothetical protein